MKLFPALFSYLVFYIANAIPGFEFLGALKVFLYCLSGVNIGNKVLIIGPIKIDYSISYDVLSAIHIGAGTYIGRDFRISTFGSMVSIGRNCQIASDVSMETNTHELGERSGPLRKRYQKPITIQDGVWIGAKALILPGVTIGENAVVAGGAVVAKDIPANTLWGGSPAKFIRNLPLTSNQVKTS